MGEEIDLVFLEVQVMNVGDCQGWRDASTRALLIPTRIRAL